MKKSSFGLNFLSRFIIGLITCEAFRFYVTNTDSTQMAIINDKQSSDQLKPNEAVGRVRIAFFSFTTLAVGGADGDSYNLNQIPKGARVLDIVTVNEALGANVVAKIGITGTLDKYGSAIDMAAAGVDRGWMSTIANGFLETTTLETLIMTLTGAAPAASKIVKGAIYYVLD